MEETNSSSHEIPAVPTHWDAIVVGGGVAGLSAAQMLGRSRRSVLVIDSAQPRNRFAAHMHGVLGHDGKDPLEVLAVGRDEVAAYGVQVVRGAVGHVSTTASAVQVTATLAATEPSGIAPTEGTDPAHPTGRTLTARALIVATGITDELPEVPGLAERWGRTVLHCPYCHGWEVRDQRLGVLAISETALHQVQLVRQWSEHVVLFSAGLGALDDATARRLRARGIDIVTSPLVEVLGDGGTLSGVRTESGAVVGLDALFVAGAPRPHDEFLAPLGLERTDGPAGSFLTVDATGRTSDERVWAVGNVTSPMANVPMAASAGAMAGAVVNMALVTEDFDEAERSATEEKHV